MNSDNIIKMEEQRGVQINEFPTNEHPKMENQQQAETSTREDHHNKNGINENLEKNNEDDEANNIVVDILNNTTNNGCTSNALQHKFPFIPHEFHMETTTSNGNDDSNGKSGISREKHHGDPTTAEEEDDETPPPKNYQQHHRRSSSSQQQHLLKEELLAMDSSDELPPAEEIGGENAPIHEIRCGLLTAKLHMGRFTCPGIHRKCVEFEGKLISPRQFTIKAEKDKQKDWKGSIRLGKHNLRTLMEMKTLDFFEHATNCSLKCQSRNYIKNRKGGENGGEIQQQQAQKQISTFGTENGGGTGSLDLMQGEQIDTKSVASSSSVASTRKSSAAVLEDFVSQTIPSMAFGGYGGDQFQMNGNCGGEGGEDEMMMHGNGQQNGHYKTPTPITNAHLRAPPSSTTPHGQQQNGPILHNNLASSTSIGGPTIHSQSASSPFNVANNSLNFLQQSPLKQLFAVGGVGRNQQQPQIATPHSHLPSSILPTIPQQMGNNNNSRRPSATSVDSTNSNGNGIQQQQQQDAAALALLLQSVQASILLDQQQQQQKVQHHQNGTSNTTNNNNANINGGILAQLLSINNAIHHPPNNNTNNNNSPILMGTVGSGNHHSSSSSSLLAPALNTATNGNNSNNGGIPPNGIERLLTAAALFPPPNPHQFQPTNLLHSQQQKTTLMTPLKEQSTLPLAPMNAQNIRKSMEENPSLFWSHMRNMGLLEDMLKILSETLEKLKQIYLHGGNAVSEEFAAQRLSGVALALDLSTLFGEKVHSRYIQATLESTLINKEILELQRKQEEQKRKLENAKRKSQCFDQLLKNGTAIGKSNLANGHRNGGGPTTNGNGNSVLENGGPELKKIHLNI